MAAYTAGEQVEINVNHLQHAPGSPVGLLDDPPQPPHWTTGIVEQVVEQVEENAAAGHERYHVRLTGDTLAGWIAEVSAEALRHAPPPR
jgi:hypothetical protein